MALSWQNIPRDPIADDEELESMYDRAVRQIQTTAHSPASASTFEAQSIPSNELKKQPASQSKEWRARKLG